MTPNETAVAEPLEPRSRRTLAVTCVHLACCALESATGVAGWLAGQSAREELLGRPDGDDLAVNVLVVAGTVTYENQQRVVDAYESMPDPRVVVAFGVCAISGGPYWDSYSVRPGIDGLVPVDYYVPGCPPTPTDLALVLDRIAEATA